MRVDAPRDEKFHPTLVVQKHTFDVDGVSGVVSKQSD